MREPVKLKDSRTMFGRDVLLFQLGAVTEGWVQVGICFIDNEKVKKFQDALDVIGQITGIHPQLIIEHLGKIGMTLSEKTWQKSIGTIWLREDYLASEDDQSKWEEYLPFKVTPAQGEQKGEA